MNSVPPALYPFEGRTFDRGGLRLHYLDEGTGPPVVMVHGNPTWSFYYRDLVLALRDSHRCLVPDHIGCGYSDKPSAADYPYTLQARVDDLTAFLDEVVDGPVDLVLHDWGGMIGTAWAVAHPERVRRLVLLNTAAFHLPEAKRLPASLWLVRNTPIGAFLVRGFNAFSRGATHLAVTRTKLPKAVRDAYAAPYDSWHNRVATLRFVQDIPLKPGDPGWDLVDGTERALAAGALAEVPTLICWGDKDFVFDHHFLARWEALMPHATVHRYPDCGHYILEDAGDAVRPLVRQFLA